MLVSLANFRSGSEHALCLVRKCVSKPRLFLQGCYGESRCQIDSLLTIKQCVVNGCLMPNNLGRDWQIKFKVQACIGDVSFCCWTVCPYILWKVLSPTHTWLSMSTILYFLLFLIISGLFFLLLGSFFTNSVYMFWMMSKFIHESWLLLMFLDSLAQYHIPIRFKWRIRFKALFIIASI